MRILSSFLLVFSLLLSFTTNAQVSIGIKGGPDFSRMVNAVTGTDASGNISTQGSGTNTQIFGGVFADISLDSGRFFYIRPGVEYIGAGGKMDPNSDYYNSNGFQASTKYTLRYIDVPVDFVFSPRFDWGRPWIGLGLYAGSLVNGTIKSPDGSSRPAVIGNDANDDFQRVDFGYHLTWGLATKVGFLFGFDYQHGFTRIVPDAQQQPNVTRLQTRNSIWGLYLGWMVKI